MKLESIVVAIDFSDESKVAVDQAVDIARHTGARLTLLHVGAVPEHPIGVPATMHSTVAQYLRLVEEDLARDRARLEEIRSRIEGQGVEASHVVIDGIPERGIRQAANELDADLIVMGTHGRTGLKRFFLGSVAERVVRGTKRNVLVARATPDSKGGYHRVLVATDFSDISDRVMEAALTVAADDAVVDVLHCWHLPPMSYPYYAPTKAASEVVTSLRESIVRGTDKLGAELLARHQRDTMTIRFQQLEQTPASGVQKWLEEGDYGVAVLGSHSRRGPARFLLGSVAEATVRHAPCSVMVIHGTSDDDE